MFNKLTKKYKFILFVLLIAIDVLLICGDEIVHVVSRERADINTDQQDTVLNDFIEMPDMDVMNDIADAETETDAAVDNELNDDSQVSEHRKKNIAVMDSNIIMFADADEKLINESIQSIHLTDTGVLLDIASGTKLDNIQNEEVFYLGGNENSPLGKGYFGKIISKTEYSDYTTYVIETPNFDEVFDMLKIDFEDLLTADNISEVVAPEGVNVNSTDSLSSHFTECSDDNDNGILIDFNVDLLELQSVSADIANSGLELSGKIGIKDINIDIDVDYDVLHNDGMEKLSVNTTGDLYEDVNVNAVMKIESNEGKDTLFPIAAITFDSMINPHYYSNEDIRTLSGSIPITIELIVYVDIQGNVTQSLNAHFNLTQNFDCHYNIVENNEWVWDVQSEETTVQNVDFNTEMSGKSDSYLGTTLSFCVFNLDMMDFEIARLGAESEGVLKIDYLTDKSDSVKSTINATHKLRLYLKEYDLKVNIKEDIPANNDEGENSEVKKEYLASDVTIKEWSGTYVPPAPKPQPKPPVNVPPVTPGAPLSAVKLSVPDYKQYDPRWGNTYIGNKTIKAVGCLVTSVSMKHSYHTGSTIYPDAMLSKLSFTNNLLYWSSVSALGYYYTNDYNCGMNNSIMNLIYQKLKLGRPVIIGGTNNSGGMHWVVVTGYNGNESGVFKASDFIINDPGNGQRTNLAHFLAVYPVVDRLVY